MKLRHLFLGLALGVAACPCPAAENGSGSDVQSPSGSKYVPVHRFDAGRNAAADIDQAVAEARKTGKRVLLDVGGDWCLWCHWLDQLFDENADLVQLRDDNFIMVAVYYGSDNKNEKVLARYSKVLGIPHFFVLGPDGTLIHSQHVLDLQEDGKYTPGKMRDFLNKWSPARRPDRAGTIERPN